MNPRGEPCQVAMRQFADDVEISSRIVQRRVRRSEGMGLLARSEAHCVVGGQGWSTFSFPATCPKGSSVEPPATAPALTREHDWCPHDKLTLPP